MGRVLVACEMSGVVRESFATQGHFAVSVDMEPTEKNCGPNSMHWRADVLTMLALQWDLMIAFPPCTFLCRSGSAQWLAKDKEQQEAIAFVKALWDAPIPRICIENPRGILPSYIGKASQEVHPYMFGHGETKTTCLWLKNLPLLQPTNIVEGREAKVYKMSPGPDRSKNRSRTYPGFGAAMALQWGPLLPVETRS